MGEVGEEGACRTCIAPGRLALPPSDSLRLHLQVVGEHLAIRGLGLGRRLQEVPAIVSGEGQEGAVRKGRGPHALLEGKGRDPLYC